TTGGRGDRVDDRVSVSGGGHRFVPLTVARHMPRAPCARLAARRERGPRSAGKSRKFLAPCCLRRRRFAFCWADGTCGAGLPLAPHPVVHHSIGLVQGARMSSPRLGQHLEVDLFGLPGVSAWAARTMGTVIGLAPGVITVRVSFGE